MKLGTPIFLIILSVGLLVFLINPQYKELQSKMQEHQEFSKAVENTKVLDSKREELSKSYQTFSEEDKEKLKKLLPDTVDNVRLILNINDIAEDLGISIDNIAVSGGVIDEDKKGQVADQNQDLSAVGTISVSFNMIATYDVFKNFLKDLERSLRLVDVQSFSVSKGDGPFNEYSLTINTYWLR